MQITLNQDEIETALRRYVEDQVNIREGNEITIDLKAGRGENGFSATIDIVPAGSAVKPQTAPRNMLPTKPATQEPAPVTSAPQAAATAQETAQDAASEPSSNRATDALAQDTSSTEAATEGAPPPTEKPRSLFAALGKPRNDQPSA